MPPVQPRRENTHHTTFPGSRSPAPHRSASASTSTSPWESYAPEDPDGIATDWPGLAPAPAVGDSGTAPDDLAAGLADQLTDADSPMAGMRMALVPARRSADIPAAIGWSGPVNHENDVARLCAVLRSWEERFGARVVAIGFNTLIVSVGRPPTTPEDALALAAEHLAFCPDNINQSSLNTLDLYAEKALLNQRTWALLVGLTGGGRAEYERSCAAPRGGIESDT